MIDKLKSVDFARHLNSAFTIYKKGMSRPVKAELAEVSVHHSDFAADTSDAATKIRRGFSIVFRAPQKSDLPQDTFAVEHDKLGKMELFLSPIEADRDGRPCCEAVFNTDHEVALQ